MDMIVYCVFTYDWEGSFLNSIWLTEELAQAEMDRLAKLPFNNVMQFGVEPWIVDVPQQPAE